MDSNETARSEAWQWEGWIEWYENTTEPLVLRTNTLPMYREAWQRGHAGERPDSSRGAIAFINGALDEVEDLPIKTSALIVSHLRKRLAEWQRDADQ